MKKVLILGGTKFIGRTIVEQLLTTKKYDLTLCNRGKTNANLFPNVRTIIVDRKTEEIAKLGKENWDVVLDISCYFPESLQKMLDVLKGKVGRYIFISTGSVYDMSKTVGTVLTEDSPKKSYTVDQLSDQSMATYGERKLACEDILLQTEGLDAMILRPPIVYGKYDPFDRHYYWLYRLKQQQPIILPDDGKVRQASAFVEDLAKIVEKAIEISTHRTIYNVSTHPIVSLKDTWSCLSNNYSPNFVSLPSSWLLAQNITPFKDIPFWTEEGIIMMDNQRLLEDFKISFDSLEASLQKTMTYYEELSWPVPTYGMSMEKEKELLEKYAKEEVG